MTPGPPLSEEEEREDRADRDALDKIDSKLRELRPKRQRLVEEVRRLSDEQRTLFDTRAPRLDSLESVHAQHQELGHIAADLRRKRDAARRTADDALGRLREFRSVAPKGDHPNPEQIRREIADLEMRQQTHALPLPEENQLIAHLRELTKSLAGAEQSKAAIVDRQQKLHAHELALTDARKEVDRLGAEIAHVLQERDRRMQSIREQLVLEGKLVADIREKARARGAAMERLEDLNREVVGLEREGDRLVARQRGRRHEARQIVRDYNRSVRETVAGPEAYNRAAEAQLAELLKRGRVTLNP
ncbi:MAG: hypothetical protein L3K06_03110 [Thermoplasmata archaeon]|nr:hypothetical protein [Thermoplasmata archaeon]MCI4354335.1 hypothetical protein [Thermoplasmata archaeon]